MGLKIYAKKFIVFVFPLLLLTAGTAWSQCTNTFLWATVTAPTNNTTVTMSTINFAGDYNQINGAVAGQTYQFGSTGGTGNFVTIRQGTPGGTVLAFGNAPISATPTVSGPIFFHLNTNAGCGTDVTSHTTTITCTSCPGPPDPCLSIAPIVCATPTTSNHTGSGSWSVTACGFATPGQERLYSFTATTTGPHVLQVTAATGGFIDYYYRTAASGCGPTGWTCIDDNSGPGTDPIGTLTEGTTYYFLLDPEGTGAQSQTFQINCPPFDPCAATPIALICGTPVTNTSQFAGVWNPVVGTCGFTTPGRERIYTFTPVTTGLHTLTVNSASGGYADYFVKPVSGGCTNAGWVCIGDFDGAGSAPIPGSLTAGTAYYIMLDYEQTSLSSQTFQIDCPPYDPCAIITTITCATPRLSSHAGTGAWDPPSSSCGFNTPGLERIYSFTATFTGNHSLQVTAATGSTWFDYFIKPASGGCSNTGWTCISDFFSPGTASIGPLVSGTTYYILVDPEGTGVASQTFQINDASPPTITCPANITVNNTTGACNATVTTPPPTTGDNCAVTRLTWALTGATVASSPATGINNVPTRLFNVGLTTVTYTAADGSGNTSTCSFTVTVVDTQPPSITCPANITVSNDPNLCSASVVTPNPTNSDNCAVVTRTWTMTGATTGASPLTGLNNVGTRVFNVGLTTITYTVWDANGNSATCPFTVRVNDTQFPVITCPPNVTLTTPVGSCTATHTYAVTSSDNCPASVTVLQSGLASGSAFPIGVNTVVWRITDASGNVSTCTFTVTVLDGQLPVITSQPVNRTVCVGASASFSVASTNTLSYQWQTFNGTAWVNIAGATGSTYTVSNATTAMNTNSFRVIAQGLCTPVPSAIATMFVNTNPVITLSSSRPPFLQPGQFLDITATGIPPGGSFVWLKNGNVIGGATTNTLTNLGVNDLGSYSVRYTDGNGCVTTSAVMVLTGMSSDNLWVYPNPNYGQFVVRFFNNNPETARVLVYNSNGVKVYEKVVTTNLPYTQIDVDLGPTAAGGTYTVELVNQAGNRVGAKQIVVRPR